MHIALNAQIIHGIIIGVTAGGKQFVSKRGEEQADLQATKKIREYFVDSPGSEGRFITCMGAHFKNFAYDGDLTILEAASRYTPGAKDEVK